MITGTLVAAVLSLNVHTYQIGAFNCKNAEAEAVINLERQCQEAGMLLTSYTTGDCDPAGSDGGYVDYYAVSAEGLCEESAE